MQVLMDGHNLQVDLKALNLKLECPYAIRVTWESAAEDGSDAVLST